MNDLAIWNHPDLQHWPLGPVEVDWGALGPGPHSEQEKAACFRTFRLDWMGKLAENISEEEALALKQGAPIPESLEKKLRDTIDERLFVNAQDHGKPFIGYCPDYVDRIADWLMSESDGGASKLKKLSKALDHNNRRREGKAKAKAKIRPEARDFYYAALREVRLFLGMAQGFIRRKRGPLTNGPEAFGELWPDCKAVIQRQGYVCLNARLANLEDFLATQAQLGDLYYYLRDISAEDFTKEWMAFKSGQSVEWYARVVSDQGQKLKAKN